MCKATGFVATIKGFNARQVEIVDVCDGGEDAADIFLADFNLSGYYTREMSQDAMDEGRCNMVADMDTLHTSEDAPYAAWDDGGRDYGSDPVRYTVPAGAAELDDAQEEITDSLLSDAKDSGWDYAQQDVTLVGGVRSMWAMRTAGQTIGW